MKKKDRTLIGCFSKLQDYRSEQGKRHKLIDILVISICAVICGADKWEEIELYGKSKKAWFEKILELPHGIPSHDTFARVLSSLKPKEFRRCFLEWIKGVSKLTKGEIVSIDGKKLRQSYDNGSKKSAIHMVSAWASENSLVLGQEKVSDKSNEITAIPELLDKLEINECIVTIDAMGCQRDIASKIIDEGADYVLALKGNQGNLYEDVKLYFEWAIKDGFKEISYDFYETIDGDHGRIETRRYWITSEIEWIHDKGKWKGLKSIGMVESIRCIGEKTSVEVRYYISSLKSDAKVFAKAVRSHWGIENSLHWVLDIAFREDESRIRKAHGPENFSVLRHIALNLLKQEKTVKVGIKSKRLKAGWDNDYLVKILQN